LTFKCRKSRGIIDGINNSTATFYVGDDIEYRHSDNSYTIIESAYGSDFISNRIYDADHATTAENQYFIKNHLGSTVTLIDKNGVRVGPVYDYFAYGKQIEVITAPQQITQTFTGKEFDLFENDAVSGEDGEGLVLFWG
jgi:hypothetical protein